MPRLASTPRNIDLPPDIRAGSPEFVQLLNERLRTLAQSIDPLEVRGDLDMRGHRILNVGDHQAGGDALSRAAGDRRYLVKAAAPVSITPVSTVTPPGGGAGGESIRIRAIVPATALAVAQDIQSNHHEITLGPLEHVQLSYWSARAKTAPQGADLIADWLVSGNNGGTWQSIFPVAGPQVVVPQNSTHARGATFAIAQLNDGDILRLDILQVGSVVPGGLFEFVLRGLIL